MTQILIGDQSWRRERKNRDRKRAALIEAACDMFFKDGCRRTPRPVSRGFRKLYIDAYRQGFCLRKVDFLNDLAAANLVALMIHPRYRRPDDSH